MNNPLGVSPSKGKQGTIFHFHFPFYYFEKENTMIILRNPQIAELIEAGCAFKSNVIISKNETKK